MIRDYRPGDEEAVGALFAAYPYGDLRRYRLVNREKQAAYLRHKLSSCLRDGRVWVAEPARGVYDAFQAAVEKAVELGVVDPERIGVTGHSHGGLMTANLIAHTDLFKAGVATSGSYNKTFTPFGFQNERRSVWQAQDVYLKASPYFYADKIKLPLLLVHGEDDANPGTEPTQSPRLFQAIRGNGGTTRLVMLPFEPHWYAAQESNEHFVAEMLAWFDRFVKEAPAAEASKAH